MAPACVEKEALNPNMAMEISRGPEVPPTVKIASSGALRVLILENSAADVEVMLIELRRAGFEPDCRCVQTEPEYLAELDRKPDLILADHSLPSLGGLRALHHLQERGLDIPFIVVTGTANEEVAVECMKVGAADYLLKDRMVRLGPAVFRALQQKKLRDEKLRAALEQQERREELAVVLDSLPVPTLLVDRDLRVRKVNRAAQQFAGQSAEHMVERSLEEALRCCHGSPERTGAGTVPGAVPPGVLEVVPVAGPGAVHVAVPGIDRERCPVCGAVNETFKTGKGRRQVEAEQNFFEKDTVRKKSLTMDTSLVKVSGREWVLICIQDTTKQKAVQEQFLHAQKMEAIGRLAGGVAHDFNNLTTVIQGYGEMLLRKLSRGDPNRRDVREILRAGERAASLTRQLLTLSRRQVSMPAPLDVNAVVADMERMLRRLLGEDIQLVTFLSPEPARVEMDLGHLEQVIMNLVVNARDAMPTGGTLTVETSRVRLEDPRAAALDLEPGRYISLAVRDTGCGMEQEVASRMFEPFFTSKKEGRGTGLGLSTVYGVVRQARGAIEVDTHPGEGTIFRIYLPWVEAGRCPAKAQNLEAVELRGCETILVVEDNQPLQTLVCRILREHGYTVVPASNGGEALLICERREEPIDLLLTDAVMPHMSGRELAERLGKMFGGLKVVYMSGYTADDIMHRGLADEDVVLVRKPFDTRALVRAVREVLDR